ncbi:hypothetical protein HC749_19550 [Arthrobacter sp. S13_S34]|nr:hypothetical protein [Arthrobacter sp. S13_S34]
MNPVEEKAPAAVAPRLLVMGGGILYATPGGVSAGSLDKADEIQDGAGKRISAPVRKWFVRSRDGQAPMLSVLYSGSNGGGRSGYVSIKVLLSLIWKTSKPPFETVMTAPALAELLDLPDAAGKGARRVRDAIKALAEANLIRLVPRPGTSPLIQLMNETGNGADYALPSTSYVRSQRTKPNQESVTDPNLYFQLPAELWTEGFLQALRGPGLVMLLILLAEQANKKPVWFAGTEFFDRYRISPSTRTKGTKELVDLGMLTVTSAALPATWGGSTFEQQRRRYEYRLKGVTNQLPNGEDAPNPAIPAWPKPGSTETAQQTPMQEKKRKRRRPRKKT